MPNTSDALDVARQAAAAAELLWLRGDREEALLRVMHALEMTLSVAPPGVALGRRPAELLRSARLACMDAGAIDERDALVLPLMRARRRAARLIARAVESPAARRARRVRVAVRLWCALVAVVALALYRPHGISAHASAELARSDYFGAARAIDGDPKTAWLLPDREPGALWLDLVPPRDVSAVHLVQPAQAFPPRATAAVRVRLYRGQRAIAERSVSLDARVRRGVPSALGRSLLPAAFGRTPSPAREQLVPLVGRGVTRVEIVVKAWRGTGGGFAEVELR